MASPQHIIAQVIDPQTLGHILSPGGVLTALLAALGFVPIVIGTMGGLAALVFYCLQIYDYPRVQNWLIHHKARRRTIVVAKLQYQQALLTGELKALGILSHTQTVVLPDHTQTSTVTTDPTSTPSR